MQQPNAPTEDDESIESATLPPARERDAIRAVLADIDRIPDRPDAFDPLQWDELGLPK